MNSLLVYSPSPFLSDFVMRLDVPYTVIDSIKQVNPQKAHVVLAEIQMFENSVFQDILDAGTPVYLVSATKISPETRYACLQSGVRECHQGNGENKKFRLAIGMAIRGRELYLEDQKRNRSTDVIEEMMIGSDHKMQDLMLHLGRIAKSEMSVLILGESGVGKEGLASYVHQKSGRSGKFVAVNCGQIQKELAASLLFGHVKGAFTGAVTSTTGFFGEAEGGTIFLDEVFELPADVQVQLLRTMQLGTIQRVGDKGIERKVNVRIVAATNRDIESSIQVGILRADFRYRFRETIHVPPLRSRQVDIPHFVKHFLRKYGNKIHIEAKVVECLKSYSWPGNVRELESLIERWSVLHAGGTVMASHLPPELKQSSRDFNMPLSFSSVDEIMPLRDLQAKYMQAVLEFCGGDKKKAATALGISRQQWYR